jgi:hypothetical protein
MAKGLVNNFFKPPYCRMTPPSLTSLKAGTPGQEV